VDQTTIRSVITPNDQLLRTVFSNPKPYFIDIYQREYKWKAKEIETLLQDIEDRFEQHSRTKEAPKDIQADVQEHFEPYFLNTYLTHSMATNISIVDGQQRLTTFLLILIKIHKILKAIEKDQTYEGKTFSSATIEKLIYEADDFGEAARFKIYNENREGIFRKLVEEQPIKPQDETQQRIKENFEVISNYFDHFFQKKDDPGRYDIAKLTYYITYILDRTSIVEIKIEKQENVAMIFEVVNDRGLGLKSYEILKGKLIGNLPNKEKEQANVIWTKLQNDYFRAILKNSTDSTLDLDMFFRTFFRAKFADSENEYEAFEGDYHYQMYRNSKIRHYFKDFREPSLLFDRITKDIKYFAELYLWLRTSYENEFLIYNKLLDQNQQYLLILSALNPEDSNRDSKITEVGRKFDQFHAVIRFLDIYDSNAFQRLVYPINKDIRGRALPDIAGVFDKELIRYLENNEVFPKGEVKSVPEIFTLNRLVAVRNRWTNFSKYVLMRIDRYLSKVLDKPSYAGGDLEELEEHFNKTTRRRYGMHLEHIYAYNEPNKALFTKDNQFDEQAFKIMRDLLGMVLLLKDSQNISSNNEIYKDKIDTYKKSNFIWNELLAGHVPGVDLRNLPEVFRIQEVKPDETGAFPIKNIANRQEAMFNAIKHIWCDAFEIT
jgi:uncharacterized protein with ParB-like and HNH nuclease domain